MKKPFFIALTCVLILALAAPALAVDNTLSEGTSTGGTEITATLGTTYILTIPSDTEITLNTLSNPIGNLGISGMRVETGKQITVTATSPTNNFNLKTTGGDAIPYSLTIDDTAANSTNFTSNGIKPVTVEITQAAWNAAPAGSYSDIVTFTASVTNITTP